MEKKDKKRLFKGIILIAPWVIGASVGPLGIVMALLFDIFYLTQNK